MTIKKTALIFVLRIVIVIVIIIVSYMAIIFAGHVLLHKSSQNTQSGEGNKSAQFNPESKSAPFNLGEISALFKSGNNLDNRLQDFQYLRKNLVINNNKQVIHIIEINPAGGRIEIEPVLSFDRLYGFESLSTMAARNNAYAAVNGGFFHEFGYPSGMVVQDGNIITNSTGKYPVFIFDGKRAYFEQLKLKLFIKLNGTKIPINGINRPGKMHEKIIYTDFFGSSNRAVLENISAIIENGRIKTKTHYKSGAPIIPGHMLFSCYDLSGKAERGLAFKVGDTVELISEPELGKDFQAYECGSWIIRNGKVVIPERDEWIGVMSNHDPRTAIGIKENGVVILVTVDGRQPGYSEGMTGQELGEYLLQYGVVNAAMLDGGASAEMIAEGKIVNRPSYRGSERLLGGAVIVRYLR